MKALTVRRLIFYLAISLVMAFAAGQLGKPTKVRAEGACCTYGQDCTTKTAPRCCEPHGGEAPCSEAERNYCKPSCN